MLKIEIPEVPRVLQFRTSIPLDIPGSCCYQISTDYKASESTDKLYYAKWLVSPVDAFTELLGSIELNNTDNRKEFFFPDSQGNGRKRLEIMDSKIYVIAPRTVNVYDLDLNLIEYNEHEALWRGFDTASENGSIWGIGAIPQEAKYSFSIYEWDDPAKHFVKHEMVYEGRNGAAVEFMNDKLYIFGGTKGLELDEFAETMLIYNTLTKEFENPVNLPFDLAVASTTKYEHLIFVAGWDIHNGVYNDYLGVYNTLDGFFTEIEFSMEYQLENRKLISNMTIFQDKLYVTTVNANLLSEIQVADLN